MIKVTCRVDTIEDPEDTKIVVESNNSFDTDQRSVILDIHGSRYIVSGDDLIVAVENAMADAKYVYGDYSRKGYRR